MTIHEDLTVKLPLVQLFEREHQQIIDAVQKSHNQEQEHGYRFLFLVTTILGLGVPGAAAANLIHMGWLKWTAVWFASCIATEVISLRVSKYLIAWVVYARTTYLKDVGKIFYAHGVDDAELAAAFESIRERSATLEKDLTAYVAKVLLPLGVLSDLLIYGFFLLGVYCLANGLLANV